MDDALPYFSEIRMPLPVQKGCFLCPLPFPTGCCYSQHNSGESTILFRSHPAKTQYREAFQRFSPFFPCENLSLPLSPASYKQKGPPVTHEKCCKYCRTSQRLGGIGYLYYKEDCSPCRTQTGTEKAASPCVRPLVWWRLVFRGVWNACRKSANADSAFFQRKFSVSRKENSAVPYHREKEPPYFHPDFSEFLTAFFSFL